FPIRRSSDLFKPSFQPFSWPGGARHLHKKECIRLYERTCGYSTIWTAYSIIDLHVRCGLGSWMRVRHYPCPSIPSTSAPTGNFCEGCLFFYAIIKALLFIRVCARSYYIMSIMHSGKLHDKAH